MLTRPDDGSNGPNPPGAAADPLRVGGVALVVRDLPRVEAFYRDVLGLRAVERAPDAVRLGAADGPGFLDLLHRPDARPDDPAQAGLFHTAFLLPSRAHLGAWLVHAGALRVPLTGASDHAVSEAVYLDDPEGNGVEVYADRPRDAWRWRDGQVEMTTEPLDVTGLLRDSASRGAFRGGWAGAPAGTRIGHVHLRVGDVAQAVRFYADRLGLDPVSARPGAAFLSTGGYHHHVAVNTWRSAGAGPRDPARAGLALVTLEAADAAVSDAVAARAGATDLARDGVRDPWGTLLRVRPA